MNVFLKATGGLTLYLGEMPIKIKLPDEAVLRNLLDYIDQHLLDRLPAYLWNRHERRFRGPVVIIVDDNVVKDLRTGLKNGQMIKLYKGLVGG